MMIRRLFILSAACLLAAACQTGENTAWDHAALDRQLDSLFTRTDLRAAAFGAVTADGDTYTRCLGEGRWDREDPLHQNHIFRIASMTKAVTSVAAMQLVERGLVTLDEPLDTYLPAIQEVPVLMPDGQLLPGEQPITLRHLLTHTSGFGYALFDRRLSDFRLPDDWPHRDHPRLQDAGISWHYGTSTDWAGYLVEALSGMDLETYFRTHITGPLGMDHTWFEVPDSLAGLVVTLGVRDPAKDGALVPAPMPPPGGSGRSHSGGAGLHSSLGDYLRFLQCILQGGTLDGVSILRPETVQSLFEDQLGRVIVPGDGSQDQVAGGQETEGQDFRHGLAWALEGSGNTYGRREGSAYWSGYFNTFFSVDIHSGIAVVVMTNVMPFGDARALELYRSFEAMVRGD
jgi:CubicO group peptidase (beta-lactamase class C family)